MHMGPSCGAGVDLCNHLDESPFTTTLRGLSLLLSRTAQHDLDTQLIHAHTTRGGGKRQQRRNNLHMTFKYVVFKMQRPE